MPLVWVAAIDAGGQEELSEEELFQGKSENLPTLRKKSFLGRRAQLPYELCELQKQRETGWLRLTGGRVGWGDPESHDFI